MFRYKCYGIAVAAVLALGACGQPAASTPTTMPAVPTLASFQAPMPTSSVTSAVPAVPTAPAAQPEMISGLITGLQSGELQLNSLSEPIMFNPTTQVLVLAKPVAATHIAIGRNVTIQAARNSQGQLVAQQITLEPQVPARPRPPK